MFVVSFITLVISFELKQTEEYLKIYMETLPIYLVSALSTMIVVSITYYTNIFIELDQFNVTLNVSIRAASAEKKICNLPD